MMDKEGDDCRERGKAHPKAEEAAVEHANDEIESQVFADESFGVWQHEVDFIT